MKEWTGHFALRKYLETVPSAATALIFAVVEKADRWSRSAVIEVQSDGTATI